MVFIYMVFSQFGMEEYKNNSSCFHQFLEKFCEDHNGAVPQGDSLPYRLINYYLLEPELEAECLDWTYQYLTANKCPSLLAVQVAKTVAKEAVSWDRTPYLERVVEESAELRKEAEAAEDKDSSDTDILEDVDQETKPPQLEVARLAPAVFSHVHEVCDNWRRQLPELPTPQTSAVVSVWAIRNARRKMEDRHLVLPYLNSLFDLKGQPDQSFYAVFDGHGGVDAAVYASAQLHYNMVKHPDFETNPTTALKDSFIKTDKDFVQKAEREGLRSGTTGVCALVRDNHLHVAWLGDSQILLVRNGEPITLMEPHKPEREDEKKRIEDLGGCVVWFGVWRVNGSLSVSRAIGDADYKPYISGVPDLTSISMDGTEDYMVLACDGLWDTVSPNDLVTDVYDYLQENANNRAGVAHKLTMLARERGSCDNISVIVVFFRDEIGTPKPCPETLEETDDPDTDQGQKDADDAGPQGDSGDNNNEKKDSPGSSEDSPGSDTPPDGTGDSSRGSSEQQQQHQTSGNGSSPHQTSGNVSGNLSSPHQTSGKGSSPHQTSGNGSSPHQTSGNETSGNGSSPKQQPHIRQLQEDDMVVSSDSSPQLQKHGSKSDIVLTQHNLYLSDVQSETSSTDINLLQTAAKCVNNRRAKRSKGGRRRNGKDIRRGSKEKAASGLAHRTNNNTPPKGSSRPGQEHRLKTSLKESHRNISRTGDNLLHMLTGCTPRLTTTGRGAGRWTVAVEIESDSAIFNE